MADVPPTQDEDSLFKIAARRTVRRLKEDAATPQFGRLLLLQATSAAGDALVAIALAGSLFFTVPTADARGKVALYLLLTMAPFAVAAPLLARILDGRRGGLRWAAVISVAGRAFLAWAMSSRLDSFYLFPLAFGILVLSRTALIVRGAVLPQLVPEGRTLVVANATLSKISAIAGIVAGLPGIALIQYPGVETELYFAALVYVVGVYAAIRLPKPRGRRKLHEQIGARASTRSQTIRQAVLGAAGLRFLVGFLVIHLAFSLRREDVDDATIGLGLLVGAAAVGSLAGALIAPRLRRVLREEGMVVVSLLGAGVAGILVGLMFSIVTAGALIFIFSLASGATKVAFDSIVQRDTPEGARGWAFARFEATMQLAWVLGALGPLAVTPPAGAGVLGAGIGASVLALLYVLGRHKSRGAAPVA